MNNTLGLHHNIHTIKKHAFKLIYSSKPNFEHLNLYKMYAFVSAPKCIDSERQGVKHILDQTGASLIPVRELVPVPSMK